MPSATAFKHTFHLEQGTPVGSSGALIKDSHIQHVEKEQQERYEYPAILHLTVPRGMSQHKLLTDLKAHTRGAQICYSSYGSPYECTVPAPKVTAWGEKEGTAEVRFVGRSFRRHDIANLTQQKAEERKRKHIKEPTEEEIQEVLGDGFRIIKSRFGTSKCATCRDPVDPGVMVAKPMSHTGRGGWSHALCAMGSAEREGAPKKERKKASVTATAPTRRARPRRGSQSGAAKE